MQKVLTSSRRWKNYALWLAIASFIPIFVSALADYNILITLPENYEKLIIALLGILVLAGIISNPETQNHGWSDD